MKTVRRLIYREIFQAVGFVALGFLALFQFFDMIEELKNFDTLAKQGYQLHHAFWMVALKIPSHLYDLLPISVLIGAIFVMARFAQSSEFTILRTGGLGPWRALRLLLGMGWVFIAITLVLGDYVSPWAEQQEQLMKARFKGDLSSGQTGAWLRELQNGHQDTINIRAMNKDGHMLGIHIQRFDRQGGLQTIVNATQGQFGQDTWHLQGVERMEVQWEDQKTTMRKKQLPQLDWPTDISRDMVHAALLSSERMKIWDLLLYTRHLQQNNQNAQQFEIELWRKVFYPLSCLVMLTLALPFAHLHFRAGHIATHVFGGVMAGISFYLLNNVFGHMGNLNHWEPWITSAAPSLIYTLISLGAFGWMVLRR